MRPLRLLSALVVALGVLLLGTGWYFAGQIEEQGFAVEPWFPDKDLVVTALSGTSITLREKEHVLELHEPGVYGVQWSGGYGQISGRGSRGGEVTRPFRLLTGHVPELGQAVALTEDAFPAIPQLALGVPVQQVTYRSPAGTFPAWYVPGRSSTWVLLVHGKGASREEMLRMMRVPVRLGLSALDITYRNDAALPLDRSRRYQYGQTEWRDLEAAVAWAQQQGARRVVLVGASMGGAIVAAFMQHSPRASVVSGMLLDSPLLSFERAVDLGAEEYSLPLPSPVVWSAKRLATLRYGLDWGALDYLDDTSWVKVPTLLVHGSGDTLVPVSGSEVLADKVPERVTFQHPEGVEHVEAWNVNPSRYEDEERRFLETVD